MLRWWLGLVVVLLPLLGLLLRAAAPAEVVPQAQEETLASGPSPSERLLPRGFDGMLAARSQVTRTMHLVVPLCGAWMPCVTRA